jgi:hypothetical protein
MVLGDDNVSVGIGYSSSATFPPGKLAVDENSGSVVSGTAAGHFLNEDQDAFASSSYEKIGIFSFSNGLFSNGGHGGGGWLLSNIGGDFLATNCDVQNIGIRGIGYSVYPDYSNANVGGWFEANSGSSYNVGVYGATDGIASQNIAIYGYTPAGACTTGSCNDAAGWFNGDVYSISNYWLSDQRIKDNIQPLQGCSQIISALHPKSYSYKISDFPFLSLTQGTQDGLIAQDVESILPQLVSSIGVIPRKNQNGTLDTTGCSQAFKAVNYVGLIPYLIGAVQEQQNKVDSLANALEELNNQVNNCCANASHLRISHDVELSDLKTIILNQNSPNPFSEETYISYNIPSNVSKAMIMIYDKTGTLLKSLIIEDRGQGSIHIYAEKLNSGIYSYSLVADGQTIDTKQMICQK